MLDPTGPLTPESVHGVREELRSDVLKITVKLTMENRGLVVVYGLLDQWAKLDYELYRIERGER